MKFYCISRKGTVRLNDLICSVLLVNGASMLREGEDTRRIKGRMYDGTVETKHESFCLGTLAGIIFDAEVHTPKGKIDVSFLINENKLDEYEFGDHRFTHVEYEPSNPELN